MDQELEKNLWATADKLRNNYDNLLAANPKRM